MDIDWETAFSAFSLLPLRAPVKRRLSSPAAESYANCRKKDVFNLPAGNREQCQDAPMPEREGGIVDGRLGSQSASGGTTGGETGLRELRELSRIEEEV